MNTRNTRNAQAIHPIEVIDLTQEEDQPITDYKFTASLTSISYNQYIHSKNT